MQTTLLGLAIAFIIALVAALIGPQFIDWNQFRPQFEAEASRVLGTPVRVTGNLDARLLPTPILRLQTVDVGGKTSSSKLSADQLEVSFALSALMRGEVRADELSLDGFDLELGLDRRGRIDWPLSANRMEIGGLAIDKLNAAGRISVHDAASDATLNLDDVVFSGDVRAPAGTMRGDGKFSVGGVRSPFRISSGQSADGKGTRLRLVIGPGDGGILTDLDGIIAFEAMTPRFEGAVTLARAATTSTNGSANDPITPWRLRSRVTAGSASATLSQIEASYGPDENELKFSGVGDIRFGPAPTLRASLSAQQLDLDRFLANDATSAVSASDLLSDAGAMLGRLSGPALPMQLEINSDQVVLGGRPLQNVSATLQGTSGQWIIDQFEMLAPGATQVAAGGKIAPLGNNARFSGPVDIQTADPGAFLQWLGVPGASLLFGQKSFSMHGNLDVATDRAVLDGLEADIGGDAIEGRIALSAGDLQIALKADQFDLSRVAELATAVSQPPLREIQWPGQMQLSFDVARARLNGRDGRPAALQFSLTPKTISLDRFMVGEGSGFSLSGSGALDRATASGKINLTADAVSLADAGGLIEGLSPDLAARLKAANVFAGPLRMTVTLESDTDPADISRVKLRADIATDAAPLKASVRATASPPREAVGALSFAAFSQADTHLETTVTSQQADRLTALLGLDRVVSAGTGPAQLTASIDGKWRAPLTIKADVKTPALALGIEGVGDPWVEQTTGALKIMLDRADMSPLLGMPSGAGSASNISLSSRLAISGQTLTFDDIDSRVGASQLHGRVAVTRGDPLRIDGSVSVDTLDLPSVLRFGVGATGRAGTAPLGDRFLQGWRGKVAIDAARGVVTQDTVFAPLSGFVANDGQTVHAETTKADIGGGTASLGFDLAPSSEGESVSVKLQMTDVDASALAYRKLAMPPSRVSMQASVMTRGRSAEVLAGALSGAGTVTLQNLRLSGLEPRIFEIASQASESGQVTDDTRLRDLVDPLLAKGQLDIPSAQIPFSVKDSRFAFTDTQLASADARVILSGGYDMPADQINLRAVLSQPDGVAAGAPGVTVFLHGTPDAFVRNVDVSSLSAWLAIRAIDRETRRIDELNRDPSQVSLPVHSDTPPAGDARPSNVKPPKMSPRRSAPNAASSNAALPPPIEVKPAPEVRPAKPGPPLQIAPASSF